MIRRMQKKEERISQALVEKYFKGASVEEVYAATEYFGMKRSLMWMEVQQRKEAKSK